MGVMIDINSVLICSWQSGCFEKAHGIVCKTKIQRLQDLETWNRKWICTNEYCYCTVQLSMCLSQSTDKSWSQCTLWSTNLTAFCNCGHRSVPSFHHHYLAPGVREIEQVGTWQVRIAVCESGYNCADRNHYLFVPGEIIKSMVLN